MTQCSIAGHLLLSTREGPADKMWALGGEFIRDLHSDSSLRKEASGVGSSPDDRVQRAPPLSRRRRSAEILRFHVPQVPPVPYQDGSLTLAVTHKFPRGGKKKAGAFHFISSPISRSALKIICLNASTTPTSGCLSFWM